MTMSPSPDVYMFSCSPGETISKKLSTSLCMATAVMKDFPLYIFLSKLSPKNTCPKSN